MTYVLNNRERKALKHLAFDRSDFLIKGQFPRDIGDKTIEKLEELCLVEVGVSSRFSPAIGWRINDNGWRCMFGKSFAEILQGPLGQKEFAIWSWPPTPND